MECQVCGWGLTYYAFHIAWRGGMQWLLHKGFCAAMSVCVIINLHVVSLLSRHHRSFVVKRRSSEAAVVAARTNNNFPLMYVLL